MSKAAFLQIQGGVLTQQGRPFTLRGVNLGGWLMMEGYILHALNQPVRTLRRDFCRALGEPAWQDLLAGFRRQFIREEDFRQIAALGLNCVRLPFHYSLIETRPYQYSSQGFGYLDRAVRWAGRHGLRVILDLHGACGSQNHDWHSDSDGTARLWTTRSFQDRTVALWECVAARYREQPVVAGYDLLNESVTEDRAPLNALYQRLARAIRRVDPHHLLIVEGNRWATDLECLDPIPDGNLLLSVHFYEPLDFTFNFVPHQRYPGSGGLMTREGLARILDRHQRVAARWDAPVLVGEFGVNYRGGVYGEDEWLRDALALFAERGFHWTYWTYKAVKNAVFPDGLLSYYENPDWVRRSGPVLGWDNYARCWPRQKKAMLSSWHSRNFQPNAAVQRVIRQATGGDT